MSTEVAELTASVPMPAAPGGSCWFAVVAGLRSDKESPVDISGCCSAAGGTAAAPCRPATGIGSSVYGVGGNAPGSDVFAFATGFEPADTLSFCKDCARPVLTRTLSKPPETRPSTTRAPAIHRHGVLVPWVPE